MKRLEGKVAVITSGAGGIGAATGRLFTEEGASVLLVDLAEEALRQAVQAIGGERVSAVVADVTQAEQVQRYVQTAIARAAARRGEQCGQTRIWIANSPGEPTQHER